MKTTNRVLSLILATIMIFSAAAVSASAASSSTNIGASQSAVTLYTAKKPAKPTNLKASSVKATSVKLKWKKVSGATKYMVYQYNASTKKYKKLATVKKNAATIKNLTAAKTYKLAVQAVNKSGAKSAYSARVTVNTKPATPTLTAKAASSSSIKLSWKKVARAAGYKIYSYNASTKKYTAIKTIKSGSTVSYTVKKLEASKKYSYAVAAYYKPASKNVFSAKSAVKSATTKKAAAPEPVVPEKNEFEKYLDIINSRKFTMNYKINVEGTSMNAKSVVSGKIAATTVQAELEGIDATMYTWYNGDTKEGIVRAQALGLARFYDTFDEKTAIESALDADTISGLFAPEMAADGSITSGTATIDSKSCNTYSYPTTGGAIITFYFHDSKAIRMEAAGQAFSIESYSGTVDSKDVKKPSTFGWVKMDIM